MSELFRATPRAALALALLCALASPARAQDAPIDRQQLTRYARAHLALDSARNEFHARIARTHDDVGLERARLELDARVAQIYVENGISSEQYGVITLLISQNADVRVVFEAIVAELRPPAPS